MLMKQVVIANKDNIPVFLNRTKEEIPPVIRLPPRGTTGPVPVSVYLKPLQKIIMHPDRERLITEFFRE